MSPDESDDGPPEPGTDDGPPPETRNDEGETEPKQESTEPDEIDRPAIDTHPDADRSDDGFRGSAVEEIDQRIVDVLSWLLDTETRAKIYVQLLSSPGSTAEEVATGTGLYPSTVREALAELHDEGRVTREKRQREGAGNNPYEYEAIKPSELLGGLVDRVQRELNAVIQLDRYIDDEEEPSVEAVDPVTISVDDGGVTTIDESGESVKISIVDTTKSEDNDDATVSGTDADMTAADDEPPADGINAAERDDTGDAENDDLLAENNETSAKSDEPDSDDR